MSVERQIAVIAHRGAHEDVPENTIPAFESAIALGVDWVEFDLAVTSDGALIVLHDGTVDRTTDGTGLIREKTLAEVRALDAGSWFAAEYAGTRIPTAEETFACIAGRSGIYAETKDAPPEPIVALLRRFDVFDTTVVYDRPDALAAMRRLDPRVRGFVPRPPRNLAELPATAEALRPAVFGSSWRELTPEIAEACHAVGAQVFVNIMGADNPDGWEEIIRRGADALETNHPAALLEWLRGMGMHR